jgi:hydrogenase nickel incorporation protein HypB
MFHSAGAAIVTKTDLGVAAGFDRRQALDNLGRISHHARIFEVSAKTGEGMDAWIEFLAKEQAVVNGERRSMLARTLDALLR